MNYESGVISGHLAYQTPSNLKVYVCSKIFGLVQYLK